MPVYLKSGEFRIYFWSNERNEPVHFHVSTGIPSSGDTKVWVLSDGTFEVARRSRNLKDSDFKRVIALMSGCVDDYTEFWKQAQGRVIYKDAPNDGDRE